MTPIVFLDKDSTLVENVPYNMDPARIALCAGAATGVRTLAAVSSTLRPGHFRGVAPAGLPKVDRGVARAKSRFDQ